MNTKKIKPVKPVVTPHCIVEAFRYNDGQRYAIICTDMLQGGFIFGRACAAGEMFGEPNKCSLSGSKEMTRFVHDETTGRTIGGVMVSLASTFLYGSYNHDISDEELKTMEQFVAAAFSKSSKDQGQPTRQPRDGALSFKFTDNQISKVERVSL